MSAVVQSGPSVGEEKEVQKGSKENCRKIQRNVQTKHYKKLLYQLSFVDEMTTLSRISKFASCLTDFFF